MHLGIVIPADESAEPFEQQFEGLPGYHEVVGGWVEAVHLEQAKLTLFVNEEGKVRGLPLNRRATALWWLLDRMARERDELVGDVVLIGAANGQSTSTEAPRDLAHLILRAEVLHSEIRLADRLGWHRTELQFTNYFDAAINALLYFRSDDAVTDVRVVED